MPLIKKDEVFPPRPVVIILVGTPFSYKTSLAITAKDPILFDSEKGSERAHGRAETYRITSSWKEVETDLQDGLLTPFKTAILDTGGSIIDDYLWDYGLDIKYTKNLMQNWGTVKDLFKKFVSKLRLTGLDLVVISHEKSKDKNDETIYDLDISGGGKQLLLRQADQIGFISKRDYKEGGKVITKTILTFWPTSTLPFCKNVAGLDDIVLPDCKSQEWEGFLNREVIQKTKDAIANMSEDQVTALNLIAEWRLSVDALEAAPDKGDEVFGKELGDTYAEIVKIEPEHIKKQISTYFVAHLKKINWGFDKTANEGKGAWVSKTPKAAALKPGDPGYNAALDAPVQPVVSKTKAAEPVKTDEPAKEALFAEAVNPDSNPGALTGEKEEDLFAPKPE
jgi:hypothetical protein